MNDDFPLLRLEPPRRHQRKSESRFRPLSPERILNRGSIAARLGEQVAAASNRMRQMSEAERKAVFFKLEHDGPISLKNTGLEAIGPSSDSVTFAIPVGNDFADFETKLQEFGTGSLGPTGVPKNAQLGWIENFADADPTTRLSDALFESFNELIRQEAVIIEVELSASSQGRNELAAKLEKLNRRLQSDPVGSLFETDHMGQSCRSVIRCSGMTFRELVLEAQWCRIIDWFEERPKFETFHEILREFDFSKLGTIQSPPKDAPIICVVDSGVAPDHPLLKPVVRRELCQSFLIQQPDQPFDEDGHGSGVASLAAYGRLHLARGAKNEAGAWIASARILNADNELEDERLLSKQLREVVEHFKPHGVRIFNLSIGITHRPWNAESKRTVSRQSWVARTIDDLCRKHDVIFVTCTGNLSLAEIREHFREGKNYPSYLSDDSTRVLDPGHAALAITVGGTAGSVKAIASPLRPIALHQHDPAPLTRCGPGICGEIKPELVDFAGNLLFDPALMTVTRNRGLNVDMASHQPTNAFRSDIGTSYAAPSTSRKVAKVLEELTLSGIADVTAPLLKAFLVNSATHRLGKERREIHLAALKVGRQSHLPHVLGYGTADDQRATACDNSTAILFFEEVIKPDEIVFFEVPIPNGLHQRGKMKRLTITVCHAPEVQRWGLDAYLGSNLKWRLFRGDVHRRDVVRQMSRNEDDDLNDDVKIKDIKDFFPGVQLRSRGTVQHAVYEWQKPQTEDLSDVWTLAVAAYKRWEREIEPIPFAVVVRIESPDRKLPVYVPVQQVLQSIRARARSSR